MSKLNFVTDKEGTIIPTLESVIEELEEKRDCYSLPDKYLGDKDFRTRREVGIGEYSYGVVMVPEIWVLPYLKELLKLKQKEK